MRILLVEDNADLRVCLTAHLELAGHEVVAVGTFTAATRALRQEKIDAIITDGEFPGYGTQEYGPWGLDMAMLARSFGLPVVVLSGNDDIVQEARQRGFTAFSKPASMEDVLRAVEERP